MYDPKKQSAINILNEQKYSYATEALDTLHWKRLHHKRRVLSTTSLKIRFMGKIHLYFYQ